MMSAISSEIKEGNDFFKFSADKVLFHLVDELKKFQKVKAVYLFGSYAAGRHLPFSDIDVCVITDTLDDAEKREISALNSEKVHLSIFDELPVYIRFQVLKDGKQLFLRDERFLNNVIFSSLKEYLSFRPLLDRFEMAYV